MIIVSGRIYVNAGSRRSFLVAMNEVVKNAREAHGCLDFVLAGDPLEIDRVNSYEAWETETDMRAYRRQNPPKDLQASMVRAQIAQHTVRSSRSP